MISSNSGLKAEFVPGRYFRQDQIAEYHQISGLLHFPSTILFIHALLVSTVFFTFPRAFIGNYFLLVIYKLELLSRLVFHRIKYIQCPSSINNINGENMSSRANLKLCYKFWDKFISIVGNLYLVCVNYFMYISYLPLAKD